MGPRKSVSECGSDHYRTPISTAMGNLQPSRHMWELLSIHLETEEKGNTVLPSDSTIAKASGAIERLDYIFRNDGQCQRLAPQES
jgi:hypothetical protein